MEDGAVITADSIPDLDDWGWDDWWGCSDWVAWHKANKEKYGKPVADQKFATWWNKQGQASGALSCRTFNSEFRGYVKRNNLEAIVWESAGPFSIILKPIGGVSDVATGVGDLGSGLGRGLGGFGRVLPWLVGAGVLGLGVWGGVRIYQNLRKG